MRANEFITEYKQYPLEEYHGVTMKLKVNNHEVIVQALDDWDNVMGHARLNIGDGDELDPQDLSVDPRYQGQGIAKVMYDYLTSHGYEIHRSWDQTDAGAGFWNKHRGEDVRVWEDDVHSSYYKTPNINEAFNNPYPVTWEVQDGAYDALAKLDDGSNLSINFSEEYDGEGRPEWHVDFWRNNSIAVTGEGDAFRIFSTVMMAMQEFIQREKPKRIVFSASKDVEPGQNPESRTDLYQSMVNRYARAWGFKVDVSQAGPNTLFTLTRGFGVR